MGFCVGVVGLPLADFEMLTLPECEAVCAAYNEAHDADRRDAWERMRLMAAISVQPHVKKRLSPGSLLPLPWDKERKPQRKNTHEENQRNIARLKAMQGG